MSLPVGSLDDIIIEYSNEIYVAPNKVADLTSDEIGAAATVMDAFLENEFPSLVALLPEPYRSTSTDQEKLVLLSQVAAQTVLP